MDNENSILVYDIETYTPVKGSPNADRDVFRMFGCYSYRTNKYYRLTSLADVQKAINAHRFLVGFNTEGTRNEPGYDNRVLKKAGIKFFNKINIDLMSIIKKRAVSMKIKEGMLNDLLMKFSLDYITKLLHLVDENSSKIHINYELFNKSQWSDEETKEISEYLKRDVEVTKKLYEWLEDYFCVFKDFIPAYEVNSKSYLTDTTAKYVYKSMCYAVGWEPVYNTQGYNTDDDEEKISGGFVSYPAGEEYHATL